MDCPFCESPMEEDGRVELIRETGLLRRGFMSAEWFERVRADLYCCTGCNYLALFRADWESDRVPQEDRISPDITTCPECGARNFKRQVCHDCGTELPR